jgi:hypothetical protein
MEPKQVRWGRAAGASYLDEVALRKRAEEMYANDSQFTMMMVKVKPAHDVNQDNLQEKMMEWYNHEQSQKRIEI